MSEELQPLIGMVVFYISVGMMPRQKAIDYMTSQRDSMSTLTERLRNQQIESIFIPSDTSSRVEYINFSTHTDKPEILGELMEYISNTNEKSPE